MSGYKRGGPKSRKAPTRSWPARKRTYPARKGKSDALTGMSVGVKKAASVHRFMRWTPEGVAIVDNTAHTVTIAYDGGGIPQFPVTLGPLLSDGVTGNGTVMYGGACAFQLSDVPGYTDFTTLFDRYEIEQVDIEINSLSNVATMLNSGAFMPTITYCPDFDDNTPPAGPNEIAEYQRAKTWTFRGNGKPLTISVKPRISVPISATGAAFMVGPANTLLGIGNQQVPHYGLKFWVRGVSTAPASVLPGLSYKLKYHLKFQDPK